MFLDAVDADVDLEDDELASMALANLDEARVAHWRAELARLDAWLVSVCRRRIPRQPADGP